MDRNAWRAAFAVAAAVVAFLLTQPDVVLPPIVKVFLGAISVALAVLNPGGGPPGEPEARAEAREAREQAAEQAAEGKPHGP